MASLGSGGSGAAHTVRVCVLGDAQTGKTSLISTAANDTFDERPPPVLPPVRLPRDFSPDGVPMLITDTSSRPEDSAAVELAILHADAIVVCFDARRQATLDSIRTDWYPRVQAVKPDVPVILACCKSDLLADTQDGHEIQAIRERVEAAVQDLSHVEVCLNCSSHTLRMVTDVFYYALKSVLYPLQPLYDRIEKRLRPLCVRALKRIFIMCDTDGDGALSDAELNGFQELCFKVALQDDELQNLKHVVLAKMPNGVLDRGLTLEGFLFLHVLFIERGRLESTWAVLRTFGYNDALHLSDEVLDRLQWALPPDATYELSGGAVEFLRRAFAAADEDGDGLLTWHQLERMYSTIPPPMWTAEQWAHVLVSGMYGQAHKLDAFLLKWHYAMLQNPRATLAQLLYLGVGGPSGAGADALLVRKTRRRRDRRADLAARNVFHCYVFGPRGCGKSSLLRALAGSPAPSDGCPEQPAAAVGYVVLEDSTEKVLVMSEIADDIISEFMMLQRISGGAPAGGGGGMGGGGKARLSSSMPDLTRADVAAFLFDCSSEESFRAAAEMLVAVSTAAGDSLPCALVACKDDLGMAQAMEDEVASACLELAVPLVPVSAASNELSWLLRRLVSMSIRPEGYIPITPARRAQRQFWRQAGTYGLAAAAVAATGGLLYYLYASTASTSQQRADSQQGHDVHGGPRSWSSAAGSSGIGAGGGGNISGAPAGGSAAAAGGGASLSDGVASISSSLSLLGQSFGFSRPP
uniref:EF-hand domain-containing protein n=1 Tax=Chlamydomonas euryale TaxID=1486919 RepID=A0A7R9VF32_9CHLO